MFASLVPLILGAAAAEPTPLRLLVPDLHAPELTAEQLALWQTGLRAELDKLTGIVTVGEVESGAQPAEQCPTAETSCLIRLAASLGVDEVLLAHTTVLDDTKVLTLKRVRIRDAEITGAVTRRVTGGRGEELLMILGDAITELFADRPLAAGRRRGVDPHLAEAWSRPPVPLWLTATSLGVTLVSLATGITFGVLARQSAAEYRAYAREGVDNSAGISGARLIELADRADRQTSAANLAYLGTGLLAVTSGVLALFTDWSWGADDAATVRAGAGPAGLWLTAAF